MMKACACMGPKDGGKLCPCQIRAAREAVPIESGWLLVEYYHLRRVLAEIRDRNTGRSWRDAGPWMRQHAREALDTTERRQAEKRSGK